LDLDIYKTTLKARCRVFQCSL